MVLKSSRCTVDMLSQILYDKTVDVGKTYGLATLTFPNCEIFLTKLYMKCKYFI